MTRTYDSRRRAESATRTRQAIVEAAVKLHGEGITTLAAVADEAGVSLPTVTKYFPTREDLFTACTTHVAQALDFPSPETLLAIKNPGERLDRIVREVFRLHEQTVGQVWTGYRLEGDSPVLAKAVAEIEALVALLADTLPFDLANSGQDQDTVARFVRAALSPLTYRALRVKNGLDPEEAAHYMTLALAGVLNIEV
ncbi:MAG: TetR/AcrR family transcriptional regulator [Anaerolineae bacterium]|nr:TetR/AcrR family transcriptional regulator [Anaerolineae bacterium]